MLPLFSMVFPGKSVIFQIHYSQTYYLFNFYDSTEFGKSDAILACILLELSNCFTSERILAFREMISFSWAYMIYNNRKIKKSFY